MRRREEGGEKTVRDHLEIAERKVVEALRELEEETGLHIERISVKPHRSIVDGLRPYDSVLVEVSR